MRGDEHPPTRAVTDPSQWARVLRIREAILRGEYQVDTRLLAERLIAAGVFNTIARA